MSLSSRKHDHHLCVILSPLTMGHCRQCEVTVTLQCSGTRRIEQIQVYPGDGDELINAVSHRLLYSLRQQTQIDDRPAMGRGCDVCVRT